ncbi:MAG TPA: SRPBCC family protein [Polyangiales bacterium]|nr:SRPBCC family protein [Polyangiales bacterium]
MTTDRIEKEITLKAPRSRVWRALTDAEEFGTWFRVKLEGRFEPGARLAGRITHPGYEHLRLELQIDRIDPEHYFSYRWHPHAIEKGVDYTKEPTTLVEFRLTEVPGGTKLTIVESGFDGVPIERREQAYRGNAAGWSQQLTHIEQHVAAQ